MCRSRRNIFERSLDTTIFGGDLIDVLSSGRTSRLKTGTRQMVLFTNRLGRLAHGGGKLPSRFVCTAFLGMASSPQGQCGVCKSVRSFTQWAVSKPTVQLTSSLGEGGPS